MEPDQHPREERLIRTFLGENEVLPEIIVLREKTAGRLGCDLRGVTDVARVPSAPEARRDDRCGISEVVGRITRVVTAVMTEQVFPNKRTFSTRIMINQTPTPEPATIRKTKIKIQQC